jgi:hypothetical protein
MAPGVKAGIHDEIMRGYHDDEAIVVGPLAAIREMRGLLDKAEAALREARDWEFDDETFEKMVAHVRYAAKIINDPDPEDDAGCVAENAVVLILRAAKTAFAEIERERGK